jgi:RNA polymerase sigma-70 factor, ECF subfamily
MDDNGTSSAEPFLELLRPIERELEIYCRRLIWRPEEAADAIQNAVLRAYSAFERYRSDASFPAWMFKILTRECFALNRKHSRIAQHEFQLDPGELAELTFVQAGDDEAGLAPSGEQLDDLLDPKLAAGLRTLTDMERAVLLLRAIQELRYSEISETLEIPLGSVMGNLSRARKKMRCFILRSTQRANQLREE